MGNIGVIGANGYIGRHIAWLLTRKGYKPVLFGTRQKSIDGHELYFQMDLSRFESFPDILKECDPVFFFAAKTGTETGIKANREFIEINEIGLLNLLEFYRKEKPAPKIIFPSSRLVYKGKTDTPLKESDEKAFKTLYALTKYAGEQHIKRYHRLHGITYTIFRICVPYGNLLDETLSYGTLNHFLSKAKQNIPIVIYGDGCQKRSFIHIHDLAEILIQGALDPKTDNETYNIAGPDVLSIREVADKIAEQYGAAVESVPWPEKEKRIESGDTILDASKLEKICDHDYHYRFDDWVKNLER